jgi:hypothetical protein
VMARRLSPAMVMARAAALVCFASNWFDLERDTRRHFLSCARKELRRVRHLGFDVTPIRPTKVRRARRKT